jgi:asparagine synthase (glutamine-hydrolysing)
MATSDQRFHVVHNGEVYNFLELRDALRAEGWRFGTETDTEVILAAYAIWGPDCVERFNGIWAFAIWDTREEVLFLSRDRFGVKPMFIAELGRGLAFASEIKALLAIPAVSRDPDPSSVRKYALDGLVDDAGTTFFKAIRRLPPAHNLLLNRAGLRQWRYWSPPGLSEDTSLQPGPDDDRLVDEFRQLLVASVSLQLRSDVSIGSCLSGGLDSSSIVLVADALRRGSLRPPGIRHHERDRHPQLAFFADFPEPMIAERGYVDEVVKITGVQLHTTSPDSKAFLRSLDDVMWHQDEPFGSASIVAQYHVMALAHDAGVKVLLDGQGADEMLAGYPPHTAARYGGALRSSEALPALATLARSGTPVSPFRVLWYAFMNGRRPPTSARPSRRIRDWLTTEVLLAPAGVGNDERRTGTVLSRTLWWLIEAGHLPGLLRYEDRNSMAFGIEARVPFLDHRLVESALALPDRLKVTGRQRKVALRRAVDDLVPRLILERRDKIGFDAPDQRWLSESMNVLGRLSERARSEELGLLRTGSIRRGVDSWNEGRLGRELTWRLLNLELWARVVVRGERHALSELGSVEAAA